VDFKCAQTNTVNAKTIQREPGKGQRL